MNDDNRALRSGLWYFISHFLARGISYITVAIFTRILTKGEYGIYSNYTSILAVLTIIVTLNLSPTIFSARYDYSKSFDNYIFNILTLSSLSVICWAILLNIFWVDLECFFGISRTYLNIMIIYLFFFPAVDLYQARERFCFEYKKTALISIIISFGGFLLPLLFSLFIVNKLTAIIFGMSATTIVLGGILYIFEGLKITHLDFGCYKYALKICLPYIPHALSLTVLNSTDRLMITFFCVSEETALYSLAYNCGSIMILFLVAMNMAYGPWLAEKLANGEYDRIRLFASRYINCFFVCGVGIMLVAPEILLILGGRTYIEAIYVILPVALGCICQFLYTMFVNVEQFKKKTIGMALASVSAALLNMILNYVFIPRFGYTAAAYTTLAGYLWLLLIHMALVAKLGYAKVYSYRKVLSTVGMGFAAAAGCVFLYGYTVIRYMVLILYISVLLIVVRRKMKCRGIFLSDLLKSE